MALVNLCLEKGWCHAAEYLFTVETWMASRRLAPHASQKKETLEAMKSDESMRQTCVNNLHAATKIVCDGQTMD